MMSNTPRTTAILQEMAIIINRYGHCAALSPKIDELIRLSMQLETELNEALAEIEHKDQLIEQMQEALRKALSAIHFVDKEVGFHDDKLLEVIKAALGAAERGE